ARGDHARVLPACARRDRSADILVACEDVRALHGLGIAGGCAVRSHGLAHAHACRRPAQSDSNGTMGGVALRPASCDGLGDRRYRGRGLAVRCRTHRLSRARCRRRARARALHVRRARRTSSTRGACTYVKRPQRYLFIIMTVMVAVYLLLTRLPGEAGLALLAALVLFALVVCIWGRDWFIARHHTKRRRWAQAVERYERFEKKMLKARWPKLTVILYLGIYSLDGA